MLGVLGIHLNVKCLDEIDQPILESSIVCDFHEVRGAEIQYVL